MTTVAIIGVGLIGGSLGLRLRQTGFAEKVIGCGRGQANLDIAVERGCIDQWTHDPATACAGADLVFVSVPVGTFPNIFQQIAGHVGKTTVITDGASVKGSIVAAAKANLRFPEQFVPGHPIAGTENSGAAAAFAELYHGKRWVLTPTQTTNPQAVDVVRRMIAETGAFIDEMTVAAHDQIFGEVSHLPHLLAFALGQSLLDDDKSLMTYGGGGLRDFLRIAASDPVMWRDIFVANRDQLTHAAEQFQKTADKLLDAIDEPDVLKNQLEQISTAIREARIHEADAEPS